MDMSGKQEQSNSNLRERGQMMVLLAAGMIGIIGFIGLAVDAGILFAHVGHLRRGVDSAALSAANQIREGNSTSMIQNSAKELILLNLPGTDLTLDVTVDTCSTDPSIEGCSSGPRKLARVEANLNVTLSFLPILGFGEILVTAEAISEAASVDLILVLDNSTSMAYDTAGIAGPGITDSELTICNGNAGNSSTGCQPFEDMRAAAKGLVDSMYLSYDRVALVNFSRFAGQVSGTIGASDEAPLHIADLSLTSTEATIDAALDAMRVYPNLVASSICPDWTLRADGNPDDPRACMRTNIAAGLAVGGNELQTNGREDSVWVVILLSDGVSNAAYQIPSDFSSLSADAVDWYCPTDFWRADTTDNRVVDLYAGPWCVDGNPYSGYTHPSLSGDPDPEDLTRLYADWVGCYPLGINNDCSTDGLGAVIFSIGLGNAVTNNQNGVEYPWFGEQVMRYIARVGYDGDPASDSSSDPCWDFDDSSGRGQDCGNYYYSPDGSGLTTIFNTIGDRIYTRLTH